jgi:hypothetical protein
LPANESYFPDWNFAQSFNDENFSDDGWLIGLLGAMDVRYIIYHKDSPDDSVLNSQEKMRKLERDGLIKNLNDNDYFTLYEIKKDYIIPYISWQSNNTQIAPGLSRINKELEEIKSSSQVSSFKEMNPKKFEITVTDSYFRDSMLVLAEKFDPNWKAYLVSENGQEKEIKNHILARGYANGWQINEEDLKNSRPDHILMEYYPIRLMWRGIYISIATALFLLAYLLIYYYGKRSDNKKNNR